MSPVVVWTIAGFDPSSGAGITADLMTFAAHGLFGCSAITALTVQSTLGVAATEVVRPELLQHTLEHLFADLPPTGVKIGMLGSPENARVISRFLAENNSIPVVLDPVLRSSSGHALFPVSGIDELRNTLLPHVSFTTPNWSELALLSGQCVTSLDEATAAARALQQRCDLLNVVVTGGDQQTPTDLLVTATGECFLFPGEHIATTSTHGTGCAFSSSLLAHLVQGESAPEAVRGAKAFVADALRRAPGLGKGRGPLGLLPRSTW